MKNLLKKYWILIAILIIAAILRLWKLDSIPPGLTQDEAALGYNAYSILKTGRDEYGKVLPVIFKSFGDFKPGLYIYLDIPFVVTLGLNEVSTRLPSALSGIISVFLIYLLVKKLFASTEAGKLKPEYIAAFVAATNPFLIYFSRAAWEANVSLCLTLAGIYFFLKAFENAKYLLWSVGTFALTLLMYQGAKLSTSIVVVLLLIIYWKEFWKISLKNILISVIIGGLISLPIIFSIFSGEAGRLSVYSIFSYHRPVEEIQTLLNEGNEKTGDINYVLFHSESLNYIRAIAGRWFNNYSGRFLFFEGDWANQVNTAPYQGVLLLSDLIFLPLGLFFILKSKALNQKSVLFILAWLILAPLPAALSKDDLNAVRDIGLAVPFIALISFGLVQMYELLNRSIAKWSIFILIAYLLSFTYFADAYYIHVPAHNSNYWRYGYKEAVLYVSGVQSQYKNIVFEQSFAQPYIYFLFFEKYDPANYQKNARLVSSENIKDVGLVSGLDNIEFKSIDWQVLKSMPGTLVVMSLVKLPSDYTKDAILLKEIKYLNGRDVAFDILKIK